MKTTSNVEMKKPAKIEAARNNLKSMLAAVSIAVMMAPAGSVYCGGLDSMLSSANRVNVSNVGNLTASSLLGNLISILAWIMRIAGLFAIVKGVMDFFTAKQDENSVNESKAIRGAAIGMAMFIAPTVLNFVLGG